MGFEGFDRHKGMRTHEHKGAQHDFGCQTIVMESINVMAKTIISARRLDVMIVFVMEAVPRFGRTTLSSMV